MKVLPAGLQEHLDGGATTLCWCWKLSDATGRVLGFTDHDRDLVVDGLRYEASAGFTASEMQASLGLGVDNLEIAGALRSDRLSDSDLAAGRYDDATLEVWLVNWRDIDQRLLMRTGTIGEIARDGTAFIAEVRGLAHALSRRKAGSVSMAAMPSSAMRVAASLSPLRRSAAAGRYRWSLRHRDSRPTASARSPTAGSHAAG